MCTENPLPDSVSDEHLAEDFANFFMGKIDKICENLVHHSDYVSDKKHRIDITNFRPFSEDEVSSLIGELNTKSCELDTIPTSLIKKFKDDFLPILTELVNLSLSSGIFPESWKCAIIRPLLKKTGLDLICSNYRPVSNLSFLSKLLEKAVLDRLNEHCDKYKLLPENQSAYRKHFSCETCVVKLVDDILRDFEGKQVSAMILVDLSAAFDTVNWDILLNVLHNQYGLGGTCLK